MGAAVILRYYENGRCVATAIPFPSPTRPWWGLIWDENYGEVVAGAELVVRQHTTVARAA